MVNLTGQTTLLQTMGREPSRKPDEFYALVEELCPGRRLDMFARQSRDGWTTWGGRAGDVRPRGGVSDSRVDDRCP